MKKIFALVAIVLAAAYAYGIATLSDARASRFLDELESLSIQGKSAEYCDRLHADLRVSIRDHSASPHADFDGGRAEFCAYVSKAAKGMDLLGVSTQVTRNDFTVTRSFLHPWTARVSYHEDRTTTMSKIHATAHTRSDDSLTLVQTLGGIRLLYLDSRITPAI
jgi:hypothetical protein